MQYDGWVIKQINFYFRKQLKEENVSLNEVTRFSRLAFRILVSVVDAKTRCFAAKFRAREDLSDSIYFHATHKLRNLRIPLIFRGISFY